MDRERFDALARLVSARQSRRSALTALLGAALLGSAAGEVSAKRRKRKRKHHDDDDDNGGGAETPLCFQGSPCLVKQGANLQDCNFSNSNDLRNRNCRGCILTGANLSGADLAGANLQGAILDNACLVDADLTGADVSGVQFNKTILCGTVMPDGSTNNSGCDRSTACCSPGGQGGGGGGGGGGQDCNFDDDCPAPQVCRDRRCGVICRSRFCEAGSSRPDCCSGECTNLQSDASNCGTCGTRCADNQACVDGICRICDACESGCPHTTVQPAVDQAAAGATVVLCPGTYNGRVFIEKNLTLVGTGSQPQQTELNAGSTRIGEDAVLTISARVSVIVRNLRITGGRSTGRVGGGVSNFGSLRLERVEVVNNENNNVGGGGILNLGGSATLVIEDSTVINNTATDGGGINNDGGNVTVRRSDVEDNTARIGGGGISVTNGVLTIEGRSGIASNTATRGGGIGNNRGTVTLIESIVTNNKAILAPGGGVGLGGGVYNFEGRLVVSESDIFSNNAAGGPGSGGGVLNQGTVEITGRSSISVNTPDNCVNFRGGTGCPA